MFRLFLNNSILFFYSQQFIEKDSAMHYMRNITYINEWQKHLPTVKDFFKEGVVPLKHLTLSK